MFVFDKIWSLFYLNILRCRTAAVVNNNLLYGEQADHIAFNEAWNHRTFLRHDSHSSSSSFYFSIASISFPKRMRIHTSCQMLWYSHFNRRVLRHHCIFHIAKIPFVQIDSKWNEFVFSLVKTHLANWRKKESNHINLHGNWQCAYLCNARSLQIKCDFVV